MTNEEIEKRFLLDLEMGLFKTEPCTDIIPFFDCNSYNATKLRKILLKNGYLDRTEYEVMSLDKNTAINQIDIFSETKSFYVSSNLEFSFMNKFPDYIEEYSLS